MKLYSYWRSSTSYRLRIALRLKDISFETVPVDLLAGGQNEDNYLSLNPSGGVPSLVLDDGAVLTQSMAMLEYLEAVYPTPSMIPSDPLDATMVRAAANIIACDIHPVNNLKIISALKGLGHSQGQTVTWINDWMLQGLQSYQAALPQGTMFSFGNTPTVADICLVPQLYNAHRWGTDLSSLTRLTEIEARCLALPAFASAHPDLQPDAK
ncbi:maleylacetoacetate isomerase [Cognatiyoonia sp. IB215182]|uniref:maleylacetoacetate isomerase n=1 Tax=Cognatiyoonia sp. IB215182 TaxID=3097353 RepID=UPI002A0C45DB|nr:maleylacetoacetate isomerase [Cognatiyoonia sp. IB215182]MDX8355683.1 maleylacetoacetate isomerase [Cognatiyoonia sp. IB215182]